VNEAPGEEIGEAHVIPDVAKKILEGQDPVELLGDGQQTRCFTHVSDIARGAVMALESPKAVNEDFNISSPEEMKMIDLAEMIWHEIKGKNQPFRAKHIPAFKHDVQRRVPDVTKAREILGFEAKVKLKDMLPQVIDYVKTRVLPKLQEARNARGAARS
jgi:nucleoside-diphosphate-sugar epimerase